MNNEGIEDKIAELLRDMTPQEKVGQLFVLRIYGKHAETVSPQMAVENQKLYGVDTPAQIIEKYKPGGIIYFKDKDGNKTENLQDPLQIATLSNGLQTAAIGQPRPIPLLIGTDQEGGSIVSRLPEPATAMPGNMALAAGRSATDARRSAEVIGTELAAVGINQNYAPVADVNVNPANPIIGVRSFGKSTDLVAEFVAAQVDGYRRGGVTMIAKHFPGHGDTMEDSHEGLSVVPHSSEELHRIDLPPFRAAIEAGVDTIMTAHVVVKSIDPTGTPATMSRPIITGLLRDELRYDGVIITDGLEMGGATVTFPENVVPVKVLQAGVDQLLLPPKMEVAYRAVLDALAAGEISTPRLDESVARILRLKLRRGLFDNPFVDAGAAATVVGADSHRTDEKAITERTTTLIRNNAGLLPLERYPRSVLVTGWGESATKKLAAELEDRDQIVTRVETGMQPTQDAIDRAVAAAGTSDLVVVSTNNATKTNPAGMAAPEAIAQQALVKALLATGKPVIVSAMRNPYDISRFDAASTYLATYGFTAASIKSLVRVLFGEINPVGKLPVAIPKADGVGELHAFGHGLSFEH